VKEDLPSGGRTVPIGEARVARAGSDLGIITYGAMPWTALEAAEKPARRRDPGRGKAPHAVLGPASGVLRSRQ
jgi:pyruvate/2-oxoglutarate/acetoin dehydrogenase E1 component